MSGHVTDEDLVEYLDGTLANGPEAAVGGHIAGCSDCRARLADLAGFDAFVQSHAPADPMTVAAMFEVGERLLGGPRHRNRRGVFGLLGAAVLLLAGSLWFALAAGCPELRVVRYVPDRELRAAPPERFHLDATLSEAGFPVVFARFADGTVARLPLDATADPLPAGPARVPHHEMLDWEYPADRLPREVLLAVFTNPPAAGDVQALRQAWAESAAGEAPSVQPAAVQFLVRSDFPAVRR